MRTLAVVLALLCGVASAECRQDRRDRRVNRLRDDCGASAVAVEDPPLFAFATSSGAGMGTECACAAVTTPDGGAMMFTRSQPAFCIKQDFTHVECAANLPRVMSGRVDDTWLGVAAEGQRQNLLAVDSARDLSIAAWTKTSMTCTKTATGVTGIGNSASTCTATAGNATVTQATVAASATYSVSVHLKRRTGTGTIEVSADGATWYDVTNWVDTTWKRVAPYETIGCAGGRCIDVPAFAGTYTNPIVAIRLGTNTDAVDVDLAQVEAGAYASTPIDINGTNLGYRTAERLSTSLSYSTASAYGMGATVNMQGNAGDNVLIELENSGTTFVAGYSSFVVSPRFSCLSLSAGVGPNATKLGGHFNYWGERGACSWNGSDTVTAYFDGGTATATTASAAFTSSSLTLGGSVANNSSADVIVRNACFSTSQTQCSTPDPVIATKRLGYIGDSISLGETGNGPSRTITNLLGPSWTVVPGAVGGADTADCLSQYNDVIADGGITHLSVMCGTNNIISGGTAASAWPDLETILNSARTAGILVYPQHVLGCSGYVGCTAPQLAQLDLLNLDITHWCADAGVTCTDPRPILSPGNAIPAQYNYGDDVHLNAAGSVWLTSIVRLVLPP